MQGGKWEEDATNGNRMMGISPAGPTRRRHHRQHPCHRGGGVLAHRDMNKVIEEHSNTMKQQQHYSSILDAAEQQEETPALTNSFSTASSESEFPCVNTTTVGTVSSATIKTTTMCSLEDHRTASRSDSRIGASKMWGLYFLLAVLVLMSGMSANHNSR